MKTIYLVRHAKSSWEDASLRDVDRPLNKRGFRDAPMMAKILWSKNIKPDLLVSSPANRAYTTATIFAEQMNIEEKEIQVVNSIYEAYTNDIMQVIVDLEDKLDTVFIFGHNPTMTSLANSFSGDYIPNVPTCGIVKLEAKIDQWKDFSESTAIRTAFEYPKLYL